jgi:hypothetical protein
LDSSTSFVGEVSSTGTVLSSIFQGYKAFYGANTKVLAVDGAGNVWVGNGASPNLNRGLYTYPQMLELNNAGTVLSEGNGFAIPPPPTQSVPVGVAVDGSGDVWTAMGATVVYEFIGAGAPVVTPLSLGVKNGTLGTRP